ncbi:MAG: peptidylprolyl isomerase [Ignavibacteria bacterium]|nr:MAG: peptidylprolyl isomerase [Ignavibacteria bacterium]
MKYIRNLITILLLTGALALQGQAQNTEQTTKEAADVEKEIAVIETNHGTMEIEFFREDAPKTVENFVQHAKNGYYNGVLFHRVIKGFMIQGGDPTGTGRGGESIYGARFDDEIDSSSDLYTKIGYTRGIMAMANAGPNTNGSQFFIMHADYALPPNYTIFGRVINGIETVDAIANVKTQPGDRPVEDVVMKSVTIK